MIKSISVFLVLVIFVVIFMTACNGDKGVGKVEYKIGTYHDKNWNESIGTYKGNAVPDKETAQKIANAVFEAMEKNKETKKFTPQSVFLD